jgi:hypothetical protein
MIKDAVHDVVQKLPADLKDFVLERRGWRPISLAETLVHLLTERRQEGECVVILPDKRSLSRWNQKITKHGERRIAHLFDHLKNGKCSYRSFLNIVGQYLFDVCFE